ncbi:G-protein coupled receptor 1-like [Silene latifolia]|uniref:G-protein coupled receptor 1-like n=1 Tax=Silene latifolia TaxID=37657 RepID=UPI003D78ACD3
MLCSFINIIGDPSTGIFCYAQGYITPFYCDASFLWAMTIAFTLHFTLVQHKIDVDDFEPVFYLYVWGTSLVMTICDPSVITMVTFVFGAGPKQGLQERYNCVGLKIVGFEANLDLL